MPARPNRPRGATSTRPRSRWRVAAAVRRTLLVFVVLAQTAAASWFMLSVLPYHGGNWLEISMTAIFAVLFLWISLGFWMGVLGFWFRRFGDRHALLSQQDAESLAATALSRTAIVLPVYHEPIERSFGGLRSVYRSLERTGAIEHFDFYVLSDSRDPDVWLREQAAWAELCDELGAQGRLFYRRRTLNLNYKSGNIGDFLRRWGRHYDYMAVLDADSLMAGNTLVRMVQLMQRHPQVGILQTSPTLINGRSLFARVQQFANQLYGPLFTTGLAAVQLGEAAFWGHNALLRVEPFMRHCGLRKLRGWGLFRGPITSHDFVESAYMGRAGYEVWLEPGLADTYEESPPTLVDELIRDQRWSKGNMQHLWLLFAGRRLRLAHRFALLNGVMSYLTSPLWLAFLVLTTIETARLVLLPIEYFPDQHQLFPQWPEWRPLRAIVLISVTFALLFLPKLLAVLNAALERRTANFGGPARLLGSVLLEILVSALLAPIRMLSQSRYVIEALCNMRLKWAGQNRTAELGWGKAVVNQLLGTLLALGWTLFALWLDPMFFVWSLPVALPLIFAAPIFVVLSGVGAGDWLRKRRWLAIPEEINGSTLIDDLVSGRQLDRLDDVYPAFCEAVLNPRINLLHASLARDSRRGPRKARLERLCEECLEKGPRAISRTDQSYLAKDSVSLTWLHEQAWNAPPSSPWGQLIRARINLN